MMSPASPPPAGPAPASGGHIRAHWCPIRAPPACPLLRQHKRHPFPQRTAPHPVLSATLPCAHCPGGLAHGALGPVTAHHTRSLCAPPLCSKLLPVRPPGFVRGHPGSLGQAERLWRPCPPLGPGRDLGAPRRGHGCVWRRGSRHILSVWTGGRSMRGKHSLGAPSLMSPPRTAQVACSSGMGAGGLSGWCWRAEGPALWVIGQNEGGPRSAAAGSMLSAAEVSPQLRTHPEITFPPHGATQPLWPSPARPASGQGLLSRAGCPGWQMLGWETLRSEEHRWVCSLDHASWQPPRLLRPEGQVPALQTPLLPCCLRKRPCSSLSPCPRAGGSLQAQPHTLLPVPPGGTTSRPVSVAAWLPRGPAGQEWAWRGVRGEGSGVLMRCSPRPPVLGRVSPPWCILFSLCLGLTSAPHVPADPAGRGPAPPAKRGGQPPFSPLPGQGR